MFCTQEKYQICVNYCMLYNGVCVENCPEEKNCKNRKSEFVLDGTECLNKCEDGKVLLNGECIGCENKKLKFVVVI